MPIRKVFRNVIISDTERYFKLRNMYLRNKKKIAQARRKRRWSYIRRVRRTNRRILKAMAKLRTARWGVNGVHGPARGFTWGEFACNDGVAVPRVYRANAVAVARNLNRLRDEIKKHYGAERVAIRINSAYRHPAYNRRIGGVSNSQHLYAKAADITVFVKMKSGWKQVPIRALAWFATKVDRFRRGGIGTYVNSNFVHVDIRTNGPARWSG